MNPQESPIFQALVHQVLDHPEGVLEGSLQLLRAQEHVKIITQALALRAIEEVLVKLAAEKGASSALLLKIDSQGNSEHFLVMECAFGFVKPQGQEYWCAKPLEHGSRLMLNRLLNPITCTLLMVSKQFEAPAQIASHIAQLQCDEYPACGYLWVSDQSISVLRTVLLKPQEQSAIEHVQLSAIGTAKGQKPPKTL